MVFGCCCCSGLLTLATIVFWVLKINRWRLEKKWGSVDRRNETNVQGKIVVVTGANSGIGKATAKEFAERDATVIMACRDLTKAEAAVNWIRSKTNMGQLITMKLDLASLESVRQFAKDFQAKYDHLDILVNNGGVVVPPEQKRKTKDGYEIHMGTNHLGHFLLTNLLLDSVKKGELKRIVTVSSETYSWKPFDLKDIFSEKDIIPPTPIGPSPLYMRSKMANALFSKELAKKLQGTGITTYALCPGMVQTELAQNSKGIYETLVNIIMPIAGPFFLKTIEQGASTTMYCSLNKDLASKSGEMYWHCGYWDPKDRATLTDSDAKSLWDQSVKLVGL